MVDLVVPTARASRLPVVAGGPALGLALLAALSLVQDAGALLLVLVGLVIVAPVGYLFDDAAADLLAASPTTLARRRVASVALGAPVLLLGWLVALDRAAFLDGYASLPLAALSAEILALGCATLAMAAVAAGRGDRSPGLSAAIGLLVLVAALFVLRQAVPPQWPLPELQPDRHHRRWWWVTAAALAAIAWTSRDPAARRRPRPRRS
ncbi:MAG: hypothetical protein JNK12_08220 [Acidimicrobiales bacterium]|nr:hypothetical protein [Acidimicrobiales bacterium]